MRGVAIAGRFEQRTEGIRFLGGTVDAFGGGVTQDIGNFVTDEYFGGGRIGAAITFEETVERAGAGLILYFHPQTRGFVSAQLGGGALVSVNTWNGQNWVAHGMAGSPTQLEPNKPYDFRATLRGSGVSVQLDGVTVLGVNLPFVLPRGQAGLWAMGSGGILFSQLSIEPQAPKLFVVMQFTPPFNELYEEVIVPVGASQGFDVHRADETYGPGLIIADIERQLVEATAVVADITPANPNVYWEVGYAYALRKPTILIAESATQLPFDVSPFRTLFYENTIAGKRRVEEGLRRHIEAVQEQWLGGLANR